MTRYPQPDIPREQADYIAAAGANPLNLYRILGNSPAMLDAWLVFAYALRANCTTPRALRELMILRTAQLHDSQYEWEQHEAMAMKAGVREDQILNLGDWETSQSFSDREHAAIALTDAIYNCDVTNQIHDAAATFFTISEMIELVLTATFYCMVPRVLDAIAVTSEGEEDSECDRAIRSMDRKLKVGFGDNNVGKS